MLYNIKKLFSSFSLKYHYHNFDYTNKIILNELKKYFFKLYKIIIIKKVKLMN